MILDNPTPELIEGLKPEKATEYPIQREDFESAFGVRVVPPTKRRRYYKREWYIRYYVNGRGSQRRRLILGRCSRISFEQAVARAGVAWDKIAQGEDPQGVRLAKKAKADKRAGVTFGEVRQRYIAEWAKPHKAKWRRDELTLERAPESWGSRPFHAISRDMVHDFLLAEVERGPEVARQSRKIVSRLFSWAQEVNLRADHPAQAIKLPIAPAKRKQERAFSDFEIGVLFRELRARSAEDPKATVLLLTLLLGQRGGEVRQMRWEMIDRNPEIPEVDSTGCAWWDLPGGPEGITKNRLPHRVCLVPEVVAILDRLAIDAHKDRNGQPVGPIFPGRIPGRPLTQKPIGDLAREIRASHPEWQKWDPTLTFRRSFVSTMHRWKLRRYAIRAMINHVAEGAESVTDGYNYWDYPVERHEVMTRYYDHVMKCAAKVQAAPLPSSIPSSLA